VVIAVAPKGNIHENKLRLKRSKKRVRKRGKKKTLPNNKKTFHSGIPREGGKRQRKKILRKKENLTKGKPGDAYKGGERTPKEQNRP